MDNSPSATRRPKQARAIRTRERILDQAEQAFAAKGFDAASLTSDILEPAGISVGSFYHQFSDKRAVLHALLHERLPWRDLSPAIDAATEQPTFPDTVRYGIDELLDDIDRQPATWRIHFRERDSADADVRDVIAQSWQRWEETVGAMFDRWVHHGDRGPGRVAYATAGLAGVLRHYLDGDATVRRTVRDRMLDDVVAACVGSFEA